MPDPGGPRVALFGGSFNPPHLAHQMAILVVLETEPVDEVWMIPTYRHAFGKTLVDFEDRVAMCRRAIAPFGSRVRVSEVERELGQSRSYDTVVELRGRHPGASFRLVIGEDILNERDAWHRWDDLVALAPPIILGRGGVDAPSEGAPVEGDRPRIELPDVSSTDVRARLARGESAVPLVPRAVMDYIAERGLYL